MNVKLEAETNSNSETPLYISVDSDQMLSLIDQAKSIICSDLTASLECKPEAVITRKPVFYDFHDCDGDDVEDQEYIDCLYNCWSLTACHVYLDSVSVIFANSNDGTEMFVNFYPKSAE